MKNLFVLLLFSTFSYGADQDTFVDLNNGDIADTTDQAGKDTNENTALDKIKKLLFRDTLHEAVQEKNLEELDHLIKNGVDVNAVDNKGRTALHYAALIDDVKISDTLIQNGANIRVRDNDGYTPLYTAVSNNSLEVAKLIVDYEVFVYQLIEY